MNNIFLKDNEINKALVNGIIQYGWDGSWFTENDYIVIETNNSHKINEKLDYYQGQRLCICLGIQLEVLAKFNKSFLFFDIDDISVINDQWYIINSYDEPNNKVVSINDGTDDSDNYITITNYIMENIIEAIITVLNRYKNHHSHKVYPYSIENQRS